MAAVKNYSVYSLDGMFQAAGNPGYGLGVGQAVVAEKGAETGQVSVPQSQSGSGIFSTIFNAGAQYLNEWVKKNGNTGVAPPVIQPPAASAQSGSGGIGATLPGGVVISFPGNNTPPVTTNTTETKFDIKSVPVWAWVLGGLVIVFVLFGKAIKKLLR